jgi:glycosyltransferase involved in cell wall biosynthesis
VLSENVTEIPQSKSFRILSVGRLREKKGFPTLIGACKLLVQAGYKFQCDIVGYGPDRVELENLIEFYQLKDTVQLLGKLTHDKLMGLYRQTTIFALPCQIANDGDRDGIPNVLMEAMTFAITVVSTDVSGIPELIIHNQTGLVTESKNQQALFLALQRLFDDPALRSKLGEAGKQWVSTDFAVEQHIGHLIELLTQALQNNDETRFRQSLTGGQHG